MSTGNEERAGVEAYLAALRSGLRGLREEQVRDIVEEIRSHVRDAAGGSDPARVAAALERLGSARELAARYLAEDLALRAEASRTPWLIVRSTVAWAKVSVGGAVAAFGCVVGFGLAACFAFCGLAKPLNPARVGLWRLADADRSLSLHLGLGAPPAGTELLGWWMVPVGLAAGAALFLLTSWFGLARLRALRRRLPSR